MTIERQHVVDPDTLADGTVVEIRGGTYGVTLTAYVSGNGFDWESEGVGDGNSQPWDDDWRIVRVLDTAEVWEPLPKGPTDEHVGRMVKCVRDGTDLRARLGRIGTSLAFASSGLTLGIVAAGEWYVLVEPEPY